MNFKDAVVTWIRRTRRLLATQRGGLLVETVVTLSVFGVLGTTVLGAAQMGFTSKRHFDAQSQAENIIRNQLEYAAEQPYEAPGNPYLTSTPPEGFTVTTESLSYDTSTDIATIRVSVYHQGELVKTFETIRANR